MGFSALAAADLEPGEIGSLPDLNFSFPDAAGGNKPPSSKAPNMQPTSKTSMTDPANVAKILRDPSKSKPLSSSSQPVSSRSHSAGSHQKHSSKPSRVSSLFDEDAEPAPRPSSHVKVKEEKPISREESLFGISAMETKHEVKHEIKHEVKQEVKREVKTEKTPSPTKRRRDGSESSSASEKHRSLFSPPGGNGGSGSGNDSPAIKIPKLEETPGFEKLRDGRTSIRVPRNERATPAKDATAPASSAAPPRTDAELPL